MDEREIKASWDIEQLQARRRFSTALLVNGLQGFLSCVQRPFLSYVDPSEIIAYLMCDPLRNRDRSRAFSSIAK